MKKLFTLLALVLGMVSCQTEPEALGVVVGGEQEVMLSVSLPEGTRAASSTGFDFTNFEENEDYDLRFILEISYNGNVIRDVKTSNTTSTTFPVRLAPNREYTFTVWADLVEEGLNTDLYYKTTAGLDKIEVNTVKWTANTEARDAFTNSIKHEFKAPNKNFGITLYRPFAKVRVVATDIQDVLNLGIIPAGAEVAYTTDIYTGFDAVTGEVISDKKESVSHSFAYADVDAYTDVDGERTLFTDYIFVPKAGSTVQFILDVKEASGATIKQNNFNTTIPVAKNKVTTIKGNVLTEGGDVSIKIENEFGEKETIKYVDTITTLQDAINAAEDGKSTTIKLGGNVVIGDTTRAEQQYGLVIPAGKIIVLDLNDYQISQTKAQSGKYAMIENNGTLTISNPGRTNGIISYGDTATLTADVGYASNTIQNNGVLTINEGVVIKNTSGEGVATYGYPHVIDTNGTLTINGGTLTNEANYSTMRIWTSNTDAGKCNVVINGGTFNGCIDFQAHNNNNATIPHYGTLTVNGGTFNADTFTGSAIRVLRFAVNANDMHATINGGTFNGKVWVRNIGTFESTPKIFDIYNGTFTTMYDGFDKLLANGYAFVEGENGVYTVESKGYYTDTKGNYHITGANGWLWMADQNDDFFRNKTIYLDNDIDFSGLDIRVTRMWTNEYSATFDGQNHTVSNIWMASNYSSNNQALFDGLMTVKNLNVDRASVFGMSQVGIIGANIFGNIENCHVTNSRCYGYVHHIGGIVGLHSWGEIKNCSVEETSIECYYYGAVGAIAGAMNEVSRKITGCSVKDCRLIKEGPEGVYPEWDPLFGIVVGYAYAPGSYEFSCEIENTTIKGVASTQVYGEVPAGSTVIYNGASIITTAEQLAAAIKAGGNYLLGADIAMTAATYQNVDVTIDGNGYTISQAEGTTNEYALFDSVTGKLTLKNIVFDGIKGGAVLRTTGAELTMDNVTVKNCEHTTPIYGLFRLIGKNTIKNSKFYDNKCISVITFNTEGDDNTDPQLVQNCEFKNNTCSATAVVHYSTGGGATIDGNKFVNNTLNVSNGATVYLGFKKNCTVTNNLFDGNTVTATSKRSSGGLMVGNAAVVTGNAFVNNTVTVNGETGYGNDVCASPYYAAIDLSGNYWGGGAPIENDDYYKEYNNNEVIINDYLTANPFN